jgi:hypothetical protein
LPQGFNLVFRLVVHLSYLPKRALFFQPITMYENRTVQLTAQIRLVWIPTCQIAHIQITVTVTVLPTAHLGSTGCSIILPRLLLFENYKHSNLHNLPVRP